VLRSTIEKRNDDHAIHEFDHVQFIVYVADLVNCVDVVNRLTTRRIYNSDASHSARYDHEEHSIISRNGSTYGR
jgi:hypothetical protein